MKNIFDKGLLGLIGLLLIFGSNLVFAEGLYFGAGLGNASWDLKPLYGSFELEDSTPFRLFLGSKTGVIGGEMEVDFSAHDWVGSGGQATHNASSLIFSGLYYIPIANGFDLYGKAGINIWHTTVDFVGVNYDGDDGIDIAAGFGLNFTMTPNFLLRIEYQYLPGLGDGVDKGDISQFTVNAAYSY